jgi:putative endonuclease
MKTPDNRTVKRKIGDIGENIACDFLTNRGYEIVERNYLRKWGEIDVVARKKGRLHFVEVKSVSRGTLMRPEDNMHSRKLQRLSRAMQTYIIDHKTKEPFQLDLITVRIDRDTSQAHVDMMENVII